MSDLGGWLEDYPYHKPAPVPVLVDLTGGIEWGRVVSNPEDCVGEDEDNE